MTDLDADVRAATERGDHPVAAELVVRRYMRDVVAYLASITRTAERVDEVFSMWCEDVVRGIPQFRFASSIRTWVYTLARHAAARFARDDYRRARRISAGDVFDEIAAAARTETADYLRTAMKDRLAAVRAELDDEDRELLYLRVDRQLPWREIEEIVRPEGPDDEPARKRREQALRKRFESLKRRLKTRLADTGDKS
jgi:RNA polymerase sigma-70 factor (ECF subfamily)